MWKASIVIVFRCPCGMKSKVRLIKQTFCFPLSVVVDLNFVILLVSCGSTDESVGCTSPTATYY